MQKKVFKVVSPIERPNGGGVWWMRCGSGYLNKDDSINVYLEALPLAAVTKGEGIKIQLRELTDEDLRERAQKKASYSSRAVDPNGLPSLTGGAYSDGYGARGVAHGGNAHGNGAQGGHGGGGSHDVGHGAAEHAIAAGEPLPF